MTFLVLHWWFTNYPRTSHRLHFKSWYDTGEMGNDETQQGWLVDTVSSLSSSGRPRLGLAIIDLSHLITSVAAGTDCQLGAYFQHRCVPRLSEANSKVYNGVPLIKEATRICLWLSDWIIEPILSWKLVHVRW